MKSTRKNRFRRSVSKRRGGSRINRRFVQSSISNLQRQQMQNGQISRIISERGRVTQRIQQYINDFSALPDTPERLNIITEMFNYIYDNAPIILVEYPRFRNIVRNKIAEARDKMQRDDSIRINIIGLEEITNKLEQMLNDIEYNESHK